MNPNKQPTNDTGPPGCEAYCCKLKYWCWGYLCISKLVTWLPVFCHHGWTSSPQIGMSSQLLGSLAWVPKNIKIMVCSRYPQKSQIKYPKPLKNSQNESERLPWNPLKAIFQKNTTLTNTIVFIVLSARRALIHRYFFRPDTWKL